MKRRIFPEADRRIAIRFMPEGSLSSRKPFCSSIRHPFVPAPDGNEKTNLADGRKFVFSGQRAFGKILRTISLNSSANPWIGSPLLIFCA
jgi:hypothetical protein